MASRIRCPRLIEVPRDPDRANASQEPGTKAHSECAFRPDVRAVSGFRLRGRDVGGASTSRSAVVAAHPRRASKRKLGKVRSSWLTEGHGSRWRHEPSKAQERHVGSARRETYMSRKRRGGGQRRGGGRKGPRRGGGLRHTGPGAAKGRLKIDSMSPTGTIISTSPACTRW